MKHPEWLSAWLTETDNELECEHEWVEATDDEGRLIEPAYDICVQCGIRRD